MAYIETRRLLLERINDENEGFVVSCLSAPELMIPAAGSAMTQEHAQKSVFYMKEHWKKHGFGQCVGFLKDSRIPVGIFGLKYIKIESEEIIDLGLLVINAKQRHGLAREAAIALIEHGFKFQKLKRICAAPSSKNTPAIELLKSLGFEFVRPIKRISPTGIVFSDEALWEIRGH